MNAAATDTRTPVLSAKRLVKTYGHVVGLDGVSLDLYAGEVLAIIGDNGAGKTTLIKCLTGAEIPDEGELRLDGREVSFRRPQDAREAGIETVYQSLAVSPALDVAANMYLGRELRRSGPLGSVFRMLDTKTMRANARAELTRLGISTLQDVSVAIENLSGGSVRPSPSPAPPPSGRRWSCSTSRRLPSACASPTRCSNSSSACAITACRSS